MLHISREIAYSFSPTQTCQHKLSRHGRRPYGKETNVVPVVSRRSTSSELISIGVIFTKPIITSFKKIRVIAFDQRHMPFCLKSRFVLSPYAQCFGSAGKDPALGFKRTRQC
jgi:hypothetical protein